MLSPCALLLVLFVYPPHMVLHVVHAAEYPPAFLAVRAFPLAFYTRIVLSFVSCTVFFAAESASERTVSRTASGGSL
jgi:hypothetical protein